MDSNYNYQLANCVTVPRIVNKIPTKNLSTIMKKAYREYVDQCESNGDTPVESRHWPDGTYGGTIQLLLGVGSLDFKVIFNYRGLVFIRHHLKSERKICFGGSYRPKTKDSNLGDFNISMMATVEDIESSEIQDSEMLVNQVTNNNHILVECRITTKSFQQNVASFVTGNARPRQGVIIYDTINGA